MLMSSRAFLFLLLLSLSPAGHAADRPGPEKIRFPAPRPTVFQEGEELTYEVRWTMFKIGTVRIRTLPGRRAEAKIDSYDGVPFVDLHSMYATVMDSSLFSHGSRAIERTETGWKGMNYVSDSSGSRVIVEEVAYTDPILPPQSRRARDTLVPPSRDFVDGLSIGYLPRMLVHTKQRAEIPTVLNGKMGTTTFLLEGERTEEEIDACDDPVRVVVVRGMTDAVGVFGMTGEFTGWFSDDEAAVPIKGELNVLLGSVTVELIAWNRRGWTPPVARE
jgi:hypothetical protein